MHVIEFKLWTKEGEFAKWEVYRSKEFAPGKMPAPNDELQLVESGTTSFKEIPVLKLCLPAGLALGNKIGPICEDIFQRSSILVNGENKSVNAIRVVMLGPEDNGPNKPMVSAAQENPFRAEQMQYDWESKGFAVLGTNDKMEVVESEGHAFKVVSEQIDGLIQKLKEVVHQMANTAAAHASKDG